MARGYIRSLVSGFRRFIPACFALLLPAAALATSLESLYSLPLTLPERPAAVPSIGPAAPVPVAPQGRAFAFRAGSFPIPVIPDPRSTSGHLCTEADIDYAERRYAESIPYCRRNVSRFERDQIYDDYGVPVECRHRYTIDHFVPLSLGGSNSPRNLWPEHVLVKAARPRLEWELYIALRDGQINQSQAVRIIIEEKTTLDLDLSGVVGCG